MIEETQIQDPLLPVAVDVVQADFTWEGPPPEETMKKTKKGSKKAKDAVEDTGRTVEEKHAEKIFGMKNVNVQIPFGQLTAIVGMCSYVVVSLPAC